MSEKHFTGLRPKMLIVVAAGILLLFTLLFLVVRIMLLDGYLKLEKDKTTIQVKSAVSILKDQSKQLDGVAIEYAHWDDTYHYMAQPNARYVDSNYTNEAFNNLKIKAIIFVDALKVIDDHFKIL
jgi:sensor domain CHASE-containing protein